ncbi:MAG: glycine--tRNA ligase [Patescibacteria group bacterium]|nr:glycine--tRNA ligase [Patescibacteria group bacterium]MCX7589792.1 glycine--tRNA ligase [Patescibacteria group bacterium]
MDNLMDKIISLAKRRGFIFPSSEIYGGLSGVWDYGPLGVELKNNIKREYWKEMISKNENVFGIDAAIFMNPKVWEASGHLKSFTDPLIECKTCHSRLRADHKDLILEHENYHKKRNEKVSWTEPKKFNLLVEAYLGVVEGEKSKVFLRGEITQGVHVNFLNFLYTMSPKLPFGVIQIGKAFRNEITPSNFTFRSREFEQMELQFYVEPDKKKSLEWLEYFKKQRLNWYINLGIKKENLRFRKHKKNELAHYALEAWDIEYNSPFGGWKEMEGIHHRGNWDLSEHSKYSGKELSYFDTKNNKRFIPYVIETSGGLDRAFLFLLIDSYFEDKNRTVLKLHPKLSPYKAAIFPLLANKKQLVSLALRVYKKLKPYFMVAWDDRGNIGKRYYSQDEIGTPYCLTIDFDSLKNKDVTVRDRNTMRQIRIKIDKLIEYLDKKINK